MFRVFFILFIAAALTACSSFRFPGVHRLTIQQGNVITQQMIDKLRPGMTKTQVRFVLGNAVVDHPFNSDRWDYIYSISVQGDEPLRKVLSVYFVEDRLSYFVGDFLPTEEYEAIKAKSSARSSQGDSEHKGSLAVFLR